MYALALHGGAGAISRADMTPELEAAYRAALERILGEGRRLLADGGASLDVVELVVTLLEDDPLFNAGRGAVFTSAGTHELEASIMDGRDRRAGGVIGVRTVRHPVRAARLVMERTPHVLLAGEGAEAFARREGLETVTPDFFSTERRRRQLELDRQGRLGGMSLSEDLGGLPPPPGPDACGTVGAVALDAHGNLAAATSTGGMSNKWPGRVGDSAIVGAGVFADNATCAVSTTGHGEFFLRALGAYDVAARMAYLGESLPAAAAAVIHGRLGAPGGCVAVDRAGNLALPFNSEGMYRAWAHADGRFRVGIYPD